MVGIDDSSVFNGSMRTFVTNEEQSFRKVRRELERKQMA